MKHLLTTALLLLTLLSAQATIAITPLADCLCESGSSPQQAFELVAEGTAGPFTFRWAGPNGYSSAEQNPIDIIKAGDYTVEVTNSFGCTFQYDITIPTCPAPSFSGDKTETCPGQATGSITVTAAGGTPPYTYSWSNGADTPDIYDLAEGIYYLTLEDSRGCTQTGFFKVLSSGLGFSVDVAITHPACASSSDGAIQLAMQPAGAYTIAWSNGGDGESVSGLAAGSYTATVTDASGCPVEKTVVLSAPPPIVVFPEEVEATTCPEAADGRAVLSVDGGTLPYGINWSNGEAGPAATHLAAGPNSVTVTDGNGCTASTVVNIPSGDGLAVDAAVTPMSCSNGPDGAISLSVGGASGQLVRLERNNGLIRQPLNAGFQYHNITRYFVPLSLAYSWSGPEGPIPQHSAQLGGLGAGQYCATVTDGMCG